MKIETALDQIKTVVGPRGWVTDPAEQEPYLVEARRLYHGATWMVVRPASTAEVAAVVRICAEALLPIARPISGAGRNSMTSSTASCANCAARSAPSTASA